MLHPIYAMKSVYPVNQPLQEKFTELTLHMYTVYTQQTKIGVS